MRTYFKTRFLSLLLMPYLAVVCLWPSIEGEARNASRSAPQEVPSLQLNQTLTGTLKASESHTYKLRLPAQTFARVLVMQHGVDVFVRAFDLQEKRLAHANDSFGRTGPQLLLFVAETAGDYRVEVTARPLELGGKYEVRYLESRPVKDEDRTRIAANNLVVVGNVQRAPAVDELNREALTTYDKAFKLYQQINDKAGQATCLQYIGRIHEAQSDLARALEYYSSSLTLWLQVPDRRGVAWNTEQIGRMHYFLGNLDRVLPYYQQAVEIHREVGNKEGEGLIYRYIADFYGQKGDTPNALEYYQKALIIFREVGAKASLGYLLNGMGVAYRDMGDLKRAVDYQNQALIIWRQLKHKHGTSSAFTNLASIYAQQGEMRRAVSFYQQALPFCVELGDPHCEARAYWRLASAYSSLGETQSALDYYAKSAAIYRQKQRTVELLRMLNSAGAMYSSLGDKDRAHEFHQEALALSRKVQSRQDEAASLSNLAEIYSDKGETQKARDFYQQALAISRETKNRVGEATNLNRLGLLAHSGGKSTEAIRLFEQALTINTEVRARYEGALALNNLGIAHDAAGNQKLALDYFSKSLLVFREIENKSGEAMMLYRVAAVKKKLGQIDEARSHITGALEIVETIRGKIASTDLRSSYFATVQQYYDLYIELLMREHRSRPNENFNFAALQVSEQARARSLLDLLLEAKTDIRQGVDASLLAREKELLELINGKAAQQQQTFSDPKKAELARALGEEITRLSDEYETLQASIRKSNPRFANLAHAAPLTLPDVQRSLDPQTLLLEYKLGDERSYLWLVSQTRLESFELPTRSEIETQARQFYELLTERNRIPKRETPVQKLSRVQDAEQKLKAHTERFRQMLLGPVASLLRDKRLVIVADGALQYVPFTVLAGANEVVSLPSISVLAQLRRENVTRRAPSKSVAVFADPVFESDDPRLQRASQTKRETQSNASVAQSLPDFDFGQSATGLPRLFASREEAKAIMALAPRGATYAALDFEANRERAMSDELNQYRILHFATHGLLNTARPQLSGVVLSLYDEKGNQVDGFLRLNQIYNLRLSSDLVVLSACSTALGKEVKGEGLIGLTRGFMYAGANRVMASLWKVDDEATAELMTNFYRNLLQKQMTPSRALSAAQIEMQKQPRWSSPYYWGAFVLQGDWR
jgi:CHAT domain-containing protein/Tfp pilus assembly protein PilF